MSLPAYESPSSYHEPEHQDNSVKLNSIFLRSVHGILKLVEILLCLICLICIGSSYYLAVTTTGWLNFVSASALVITIFFLFLNLFSIRLPGPWVIIEFVYLALTCIMFILSMIIAAASPASNKSGSIATAIFCALAAVAFAAECIVRFRIYKEHGNFVISSTEVTTRRVPDPRSVLHVVNSNLNNNTMNQSNDSHPKTTNNDGDLSNPSNMA